MAEENNFKGYFVGHFIFHYLFPNCVYYNVFKYKNRQQLETERRGNKHCTIAHDAK